MDLSPAEETLIEMLRGTVGIDFSMTVTWLGPSWSVSITSEEDGHLAGQGATFRQAFRAAFGVTDPPSGGVQSAPRPSLRLVAGTDGQGPR